MEYLFYTKVHLAESPTILDFLTSFMIEEWVMLFAIKLASLIHFRFIEKSY